MFRQVWREMRRYPSAMFGLTVIVFLVLLSIYAVVKYPYQEAIRLWRGGEDIWGDTPKLVPPRWYNWFRREKLPDTIILTSDSPQVEVVPQPSKKKGVWVDHYLMRFDFPYDDFPQEIQVTLTATYEKKAPFVVLVWVRPDGEEIRLKNATVKEGRFRYRVLQDNKLHQRLKLPRTINNIVGIMAQDPQAKPPKPMKGTYTLRLEVYRFGENDKIQAKMVAYGKVYGWAGTDHLRRDLSVALLWGAPVALAFGLLAAVGTTVTTMIIAAIGVWFGGWVDAVIQRITEINLVLPVLPILIMIGVFYSRSLWVMLGAVIALSIFGASIKTYRAMFLQIKASPYIEAARAYGAGDFRIILLYMVPRIIPTLIPSLVTLIPSFVFLEASLAVLGLGDPVLPTWGKVIDDARVNGALYQGLYYWVLEPSFMLMITGIGFASLGFSLDRIFNPRLREL